MAIFGFGKKKEEVPPAAPGLPIDQVRALKQQGMGNDQIIQDIEMVKGNIFGLMETFEKELSRFG